MIKDTLSLISDLRADGWGSGQARDQLLAALDKLVEASSQNADRASLVDVCQAARARFEQQIDDATVEALVAYLSSCIEAEEESRALPDNESILQVLNAASSGEFTFVVQNEDEASEESESAEPDNEQEEAAQLAEADAEAEHAQADEPAEKQVETDPEMLEVFVQESLEHLENIELLVLEYDSDQANREPLDAMFRAFHTIKGTAGFFGFTGVQNLAHETETLLDKVREGQAQFTPALGGLVLQVRDVLLSMIEEATQTATDVACDPSVLDSVVNFSDTNEQPPVAAAPKPSKSGGMSNPARDVVKVEANRLDSLVDLVGELVIGQSIICESINNIDDLPDRLLQGTKHLTSITRDLQSLSTSLRMVSIKPVFQRMKRLVRDLSVQTGKEVVFEVAGEETEVDKSLVDEIGDPLVHLIRNAVDHGLEDTDTRLEQGKPRQGNLRLAATQRGSWIFIELTDDGKGLDSQKILDKAIERGLVEPDQELSDKRIHELILHPGFSTADKVTDVSGRGVGMDVVNQTIESLRGQLDITSTKGSGTTFTLRLPLTLAIIDGVVIRVGQERYIVPAACVVQSIRQEGHANSTIAGEEEVVVYRGEAMPLVRLNDIFDIDNSQENPDEALMMILDDEERRFALVVDELVGKQQVVIKSLDMLLKNTPGIAGSAIMPDGTVGLILDVESLSRDLEHRIDTMAVG